ncbi:type I restriction-modification system subunit M N-terminal domain-containing protein [Streptomyces luteireticuli]|uniref:type I restriction-modification system subunit M N-terminal domain-containing protein n=1 Tax=Streptomyces luteireticuli TaxID=173858 RepID=UPI0031D0035E
MSGSGRQSSRHIWSLTDLLRGDSKASEYGSVALPFTVLPRLDCLPAPTRPEALNDTAVLRSLEEHGLAIPTPSSL